MLAIKFQRIGKKHQPSYRLVVAEKRSKLGGPPVEDVGSYNSFTKAASVKKERVLHWISRGAQPTPTVHNFLVREKILDAPKIKLTIPAPKKAAEKASASVAAIAPAEKTPENLAEKAAENIPEN